VKVTGVVVELIDVPRDAELEFNEWCDRDRLPELVALPGVLTGRRYHAEDLLMQYHRYNEPEGAPISQARYCVCYLLGDPDLLAVANRLQEAGQRLSKEKAMLPRGKVVLERVYRLKHAYGANRTTLSADALPFAGHMGLQVAAGHVPNPKDIPEATEWWHSGQYPDMLGLPGWLAGLRCEPLGEEGKGKFMHLFLLDVPAKQAHEELEKKLPEWLATGRMPHPRGIYKRIFSGPFSVITPLNYEFLH
jgi:hypothetical protein